MGAKIGEAHTLGANTATPASIPSKDSGLGIDKPKHQKILYVKVIHLRLHSADTPAYEFIKSPPGESMLVYDEAAYYSLHAFSAVLPDFQWSVTTSGSAIPHAIHPWQDTISYLDPQEAGGRLSNLAPICPDPSNVYLAVTTMYNGLQPGHEEAYAKVERDAEYVRIIVDFASLADPKPRFRERPEGVIITGDGSLIILPALEIRPWVFTVFRTDMKKRQILKIRWKIDWSGK